MKRNVILFDSTSSKYVLYIPAFSFHQVGALSLCFSKILEARYRSLNLLAVAVQMQYHTIYARLWHAALQKCF